jgi:hypothetical protein
LFFHFTQVMRNRWMHPQRIVIFKKHRGPQEKEAQPSLSVREHRNLNTGHECPLRSFKQKRLAFSVLSQIENYRRSTPASAIGRLPWHSLNPFKTVHFNSFADLALYSLRFQVQSVGAATFGGRSA